MLPLLPMDEYADAVRFELLQFNWKIASSIPSDDNPSFAEELRAQCRFEGTHSNTNSST